jgi:hypothetical protein
MNKYEAFIESCLNKFNYVLAKDLNLLIQKKFGISSGTARANISRSARSNIIKSSNPISFGNGQYAYFLKGKILTKEMILQITKEHRPPLYRILMLMELNRGIISNYEASKVASAPIDTKKSKSSAIEKLISELKELNLAIEVRNPKGVPFIIFPKLADDADILMERHLNKMMLDAIFIPDILKYLQKTNIIDNIKTLYRNKSTPYRGVTQNNYLWDSIAYTRTTGLNEGKASLANSIEKQTLVALDIIVSRDYSDYDLQGFLARIQGMLNSVKSGKRKVIPIIIYSGLESEKVLNTIHKLGFLCFDLGAIYGSKIYQVIHNLVLLKQAENFATTFSESPEKIIESTLLTMRNSGQEDNLQNIKGDLFESLLLEPIKVIFPDADVERGRKIFDPENEEVKAYEYDFIIKSSRRKEIIVIELKGYFSSNYISLGDHETRNTVKWFFNRTFPIARSVLYKESNNYKVTGCFITTAGLKDDSLHYLEKLNSTKLKPKQIDCWYDGKKLMELLKSHEMSKTIQIIQKYYIDSDTTV